MSRRRFVLGSLPVAGLLFGAATLVAQTPPQPAGGVIRAVMTPAPANRISLSVEQVRALMIAHHRDVASGTSEDNTVTMILASNGDYVASGSSKMAVLGGAGGAAGFVRAVPSGTLTVDTARARSVATGQAVAVLSPLSRDDSQPRMMSFPGIGDVDARLVQDMYFKNYEPGEVSVNTIRVRFVTLSGNVIK